jgi:hypothetical protein
VIVAVNLFVTVGLVVALPIGLRRINDPGAEALSRVWLLAAVPGAIAVWMPRGPDAVAMTSLYFAATFALAACSGPRLYRTRSLAPRELAVLTALNAPVYATAVGLVDRAGYDLLGINPTLLLLAAAQVQIAACAFVFGVGALRLGNTHAG